MEAQGEAVVPGSQGRTGDVQEERRPGRPLKGWIMKRKWVYPSIPLPPISIIVAAAATCMVVWGSRRPNPGIHHDCACLYPWCRSLGD